MFIWSRWVLMGRLEDLLKEVKDILDITLFNNDPIFAKTISEEA